MSVAAEQERVSGLDRALSLHRLPDHWSTKPLFATVTLREERNTGLQESNLLSLSYGNIVRKDIQTSEGLLPASFETYQIIRRGDIVFRFTDLQNDQRSLRSGLANEQGIITSAYVAVAPRQDVLDPRFLAYEMRAYDINKVFYGQAGGVRQGLKYADVRRLPVVFPPLDEQRAIADYLDEQTAKTDALIAKQNEMIGLLDERRVSVISAEVLGLQDNGAKFDAGVDWLPPTPTRWPVARAKTATESVLGGDWGTDPEIAGDGVVVRIVRVADFDRGTRTVSDVPTLRRVKASTIADRGLRRGDLVLEKSGGGPASPCGFIAMYTGDFPAVPSNFMARVRLAPNHDERFWLYAHAALYGTGLTQRSVKQTTGIGNVDTTAYFDEKFPMPPHDEQLAIADRLDAETAQIDALIAKTREHIALAQERRSALITAAVTGQIDVRTATREVVA